MSETVSINSKMWNATKVLTDEPFVAFVSYILPNCKNNEKTLSFLRFTKDVWKKDVFETEKNLRQEV